MPNAALDWLDSLPDMRISGVTGVTGVTPQKTVGFEVTPNADQGVTGCAPVTPVTPTIYDGVTRKPAENRQITPVTPVTPENCLEQIEAGLIRLRRRSPPNVTMPTMWWGLVIDATRLHADGWTEKALGFGWSLSDLYGIGPKDEQQFSGLAAWLNGREVVMLDKNLAVAANMSRGAAIGRSSQYRRRTPRTCEPVMIWNFGRTR